MKKSIMLLFKVYILATVFSIIIYPNKLEPEAPEYHIRDIRILDRNTIQVYAWNSGGDSDYIEWKISGINDWTPLSENEMSLIDGTSSTSNKHLFLILDEDYFSAGNNYTFYLRGGNNSGTDQTSYQFSDVFHNDVSSWNIKVPIVSSNEINNLNEYQFQKTISFSSRIGKQSQTILPKFTPKLEPTQEMRDLVSFVEYDQFGLPSTSYLPYTKLVNGNFRTDPLAEQEYYYNNPPVAVVQSDYPHSVSVIETTPLLRTTKQGFPGQDWQPVETGVDHTVNISFKTNGASEVLIWKVVGTDLVGTEYYAVGELYKTKIEDENNVISYVYKDKNEREILKETLLDAEWVKTYYVYDEFDNLCFIIPPEANKEIPSGGTLGTNNPTRVSWITEFKYDGLNRQIEKIMPEEEPVYTVYDLAGRVVLRQDGIMKENDDWLFTKFDRKGRVIITGIYHNPVYTSRISMQNHVNQNIGPGKTYEFYETHTNTEDYSEFHGYTDNAFPPLNSGWTRPWTVNYYDDYDFDNDGTDNTEFDDVNEFPSADYTDPLYPDYTISGHSPFYRINDKMTMTKVLVFGSSGTARLFGSGEYDYNPPSPQYLYYQGDITLKPGFHTYPDQEVHIGPNIVVPPGATTEGEDWLETAMFYDKYGRVIQTNAQNNLGENDLLSTQYDFSGKVIRTISDHSSEYDDVKVLNRFTYDHTGRLVRTYQTINDAQFELVVTENEYNELGQLIKKNLHYPDEPINNPINVFLQSWDYSYNIRGWLEFVNDHNNFDGSIFSYRLRYNNPWGSTGNEPYYNGNISSVTWGDPDTSPNVIYNAYTYDDLNRLKQSQIYHWFNGGWNAPQNEYKAFFIQYDLNGNLKRIIRHNGTDGSIMDNLTYTYDENAGNRLIKVEDTATESWADIDYRDNGMHEPVEYSYDGNGNMIEDKNKGITVTYN